MVVFIKDNACHWSKTLTQTGLASFIQHPMLPRRQQGCGWRRREREKSEEYRRINRKNKLQIKAETNEKMKRKTAVPKTKGTQSKQRQRKSGQIWTSCSSGSQMWASQDARINTRTPSLSFAWGGCELQWTAWLFHLSPQGSCVRAPPAIRQGSCPRPPLGSSSFLCVFVTLFCFIPA